MESGCLMEGGRLIGGRLIEVRLYYCYMYLNKPERKTEKTILCQFVNE